MIIKSTRVRARGSALKKLIAHIENADDNEEVVSLRGNFADLWDAREDARAFGREYCVRQWVVSPSRDATFDKMLEAVDRLAVEFGFDPAKAVVRGHKKAKAQAAEALFDKHLHILVPEVDPITGRVLSSSNDWLRGEKVGKILSFDWQEALVESVNPKAILAALKRDGRDDVAAAYRKAFPEGGPRPVAAFDAAAQQRLKRKGLDLPALRVLIEGAWTSAANRSQVQANLLTHGLVCKAGDKPGVYLIETADGEQVGSLGRLAKVRKADLLKKMELPDARPAEEAHHGGSDLSQHADAAEAVGAHQSTGGCGTGFAPAGPPWDDAGHDEPDAGIRPADDREAGQDHRIAGGAVDREGSEGHAERLRAARGFQFALGLVPFAERLQAMLGTANRIALSSEQRTVVELGEIEDDARHARAMIDAPPSEPSTLIAARTALKETGQKVQALETKFGGACLTLQQLQRRPAWWRRAIGLFTGENARRGGEVRAAVLQQSKAQAALTAAKTERSNADSRLTRELQHHQDSVREHVEKWTKVAKAAEAKAAGAVRAHELLLQLPGAIALGAAGLCEIAATLTPQRERRFDADDFGDTRLSAQP
ncbi:hypothetical protein [Bradyrhizobium sp.]|jgi:hypothetical protein|uniref:hypothetical protein n=1 Tax=Bradyrhizobium sp. TaxID=376 RepID=UPI003C25E8A6